VKRGKSYIESAKLIDANKLYDVEEAMDVVTKAARAKFDETVESWALIPAMPISRSAAQ